MWGCVSGAAAGGRPHLLAASGPGRSVSSVKVGRNDPCPCGSGTKVKRCCGVDGVRRSQEALGDLFGLAFHFPRQRPVSPTFDAWAARAGGELTRDLLEDGLAQLGPAEVERIPAEFAAAHPQVWEAILTEAGRRDDALATVLIGAVVAGLEERQRQLDPAALELLDVDDDAREDPVESLALVLVAGDLWSVFEVIEAVDSFDDDAQIASIADRLWSEWHERRLDQLVERLEARLPIPECPAASAAVEAACQAFRDDPDVRIRLRGELLLDALPTALDAVRLAA